jgi:hypothetical protein
MKPPESLTPHELQPVNSLGSVMSLKRQMKSSSSLATWDAPHETDAEFKEIERAQDVALFEVITLEQKVERDGYIVGKVADDDYMIVLDTKERDDGDDACDGWLPRAPLEQHPESPASGPIVTVVLDNDMQEGKEATLVVPSPQLQSRGTMVGLSATNFDPKSKYTIESVSNSGFVLNSSGGDGHNGTSVQVWDITHHAHHHAHAQWQFVAQPDGTYFVVSSNSRKVLSVEGESLENGANIEVWEELKQKNQRFRVTLRDAGYSIQAVCSGKYVSLGTVGGGDDEKAQNGTNVCQTDDAAASNSQWAIVAIKDSLNLSRVIPLTFDGPSSDSPGGTSNGEAGVDPGILVQGPPRGDLF